MPSRRASSSLQRPFWRLLLFIIQKYVHCIAVSCKLLAPDVVLYWYWRDHTPPVENYIQLFNRYCYCIQCSYTGISLGKMFSLLFKSLSIPFESLKYFLNLLERLTFQHPLAWYIKPFVCNGCLACTLTLGKSSRTTSNLKRFMAAEEPSVVYTSPT